MPTIDSAVNAALQAKSSAVHQQIGIALLAKSQAVTKQQGQAAVELLNATAQLSKALGKGHRLDTIG